MEDPLLQPPLGILLYGPPGCGKTMIGKAIATSINAQFFDFNIANVKNKFVGESEKSLTALFSLARKLQPSVIFVDEIDSYLKTRDEMD